VDIAMGRGWQEQHGVHRDAPAVVFVDLGTVRDPSVIALGFEQDGIAHIARLIYRRLFSTEANCSAEPVVFYRRSSVMFARAVVWAVTARSRAATV
jgi:hypothetical protein